jgi:hypothetical protein
MYSTPLFMRALLAVHINNKWSCGLAALQPDKLTPQALTGASRESGVGQRSKSLTYSTGQFYRLTCCAQPSQPSLSRLFISRYGTLHSRQMPTSGFPPITARWSVLLSLETTSTTGPGLVTSLCFHSVWPKIAKFSFCAYRDSPVAIMTASSAASPSVGHQSDHPYSSYSSRATRDSRRLHHLASTLQIFCLFLLDPSPAALGPISSVLFLSRRLRHCLEPIRPSWRV